MLSIGPDNMKFTTLIPTSYNDGAPVDLDLLDHLIESLYWPFGGMTNEGVVNGCWVDDDGTRYSDRSIKISIECDRTRLEEAIKGVRRIGRRLKQRAMYFEVSGYDGVQFLRMK
jgi:hypothetical protein